MGLTIFVPNRHWHFNRVLRAIWVGNFYRPRALARLRYIWRLVLSPFSFKVRNWLPIWIRDRHGILGIWYLVQVRRHTICRVRVVLVGIIRHHVNRYVHGIKRPIWVRYFHFPGCVTSLGSVWCLFPSKGRPLWEVDLLAVLILSNYRPGWHFLQFHTAWHIWYLAGLGIVLFRVTVNVHGYARYFFTRAVWVGYSYRPGLVAWRSRVN